MKKNILLLTITTLILLLFCEIFIRLFFPQINEHDQMFQKDIVLGWKFIPDHTGNIVYAGEVNHSITTNSNGFRDIEFSEKKGAKKVMVLGDSFVSNISVGQDEVFTSLLEQYTPNTAVFNLGVNGYSTVQEYLTLQKWLPEIKPDLIVMMIYLRNDFTDNLGTTQWLYPRPTASFNENTSITIQSPSMSASTPGKSLPFYYRSHLFRFIKTRLGMMVSKTDQEAASQFLPPEYYICRSPISEETQKMYEVMQQMFLEINSFAKKNNTPVVFALAPSIMQVDSTLWKSVATAAQKDQIDLVRDLPNKILTQFAKDHKLRIVDLLPPLQMAQQNGIKTYHPKEQHWTVAGNDIVANTLKNYLDTISY